MLCTFHSCILSVILLTSEYSQITQANLKAESAYKSEIADLNLTGVKKDDEISRLQDKISDLKDNLARQQQETDQKVLQIDNLVSEHGKQIADLFTKHKEEVSEQSTVHEHEMKSLVDKNCDIVQVFYSGYNFVKYKICSSSQRILIFCTL